MPGVVLGGVSPRATNGLLLLTRMRRCIRPARRRPRRGYARETIRPLGHEALDPRGRCCGDRMRFGDDLIDRPPVRQRSSQSEVSEYSATTGSSIQSRMTRRERLLMTIASTRSAADAISSLYRSSCSANSCGLIAATIFTLSPRSSSWGRIFTRFAVVEVPCTKIVPIVGCPAG